jgi:hypothetical protein
MQECRKEEIMAELDPGASSPRKELIFRSVVNARNPGRAALRC